MMAMSLQQRPLPFFNGSLLFSSSNRQFPHRSTTIFRWSFGRDQGSSLVTSRTKGRAFRILANPNVSSGKGNSGKEVIMVDPLEAKRLAAKQMISLSMVYPCCYLYLLPRGDAKLKRLMGRGQ
ncbi:hypothetical protein V6Z12_D05G007500 [Gossypium hirsutum]